MADVELLPLPEPLLVRGDIGGLYTGRECQHHARANVAHATAAQAAEIETLRAEVERLNRLLGRIVEGDSDSTLTIRAGTDAFAAAREYLSAHKPESADQAQALRAEVAEWKRVAAAQAELHVEAEARAERLAEALRLIESAKDRGFGIDYARGVAQSALRDHDQEDRND